MTQLRIGFNINGANAGDNDAIVEWHRDNKPTWALVMDATGLAAEIKAASPTTNVVLRVYSVDGEPGLGHEETAKTWTPEAFITEAIKQQERRDLWVQVGNECGFSDDLLIWTAQIISRAAVYNLTASQPLKLVVLNHAVGTPQPNDWKRAAAVKVLELASKYREWCVIGCHEYFNIVPTSGFRGGNPTWIQPEDWPIEPRNAGALWHCGRFQFALDACRENGITPYPRMVLTEHGTDDVSDIKQWVESFGQGTGRGWKHAAKLWALPSFYPGKPKEEIFAGMLKYLDERLYQQSPVEGQLIFTINKNADWEAFDAAEMLGHIKADEVVTVPSPAPPPVVVEPPHPGAAIMATNRNTGVVIVRHIASKTNGKQVGVIPVQADYTYYPATSVEADGYTWVWVECGDVRGWSALEALAVDDAPQEPPESSTDCKVLETRIVALEADVTTLLADITKLNYILAGIGQLIESKAINGKES